MLAWRRNDLVPLALKTLSSAASSRLRSRDDRQDNPAYERHKGALPWRGARLRSAAPEQSAEPTHVSELGLESEIRGRYGFIYCLSGTLTCGTANCRSTRDDGRTSLLKLLVSLNEPEY